MKSGPRLPQLEKALEQKWRPNTAKNKQINNFLKKQNKQTKKTIKKKTDIQYFSYKHEGSTGSLVSSVSACQD